MITTPIRRLWLYPAPDGALEILILGDDDAVAVMYARIRQLAENWHGFDRVSALGQSGAVVGVRVTLAESARYREPVREAIFAMKSMDATLITGLAWDMLDANGPLGVVGTW